MKRMVAFIFIILAFFGVGLFKNDSLDINDYERVVIVSKLDDLTNKGSKVQNGEDYYYYLNYQEGESVRKNLSSYQISGIIFYLSKEYSFNSFNKKFDYTLSAKSIVEDNDVYYGYDKDYSDFRLVGGKKINLQLVKSDNNWILGYPMILTGF